MEIISNVEMISKHSEKNISKYPELNKLMECFTETGDKIEVGYSIHYVVRFFK
ncbi:unnamed protein product [Meloidogyne enterolobii]|uniref:Uncharacterized protein n=1 Tax=Meloidogyne enterolobii TaxID=390850 RepID=A0ACB0YGQ9_MELEN